jgi:hypothetical protein
VVFAAQAAIQDAAQRACGGDVGFGRVAAATDILPYMRVMGHPAASELLRWGGASQQVWRGAHGHHHHRSRGVDELQLHRGLLCAEVMTPAGGVAAGAETEDDIEDD